MYCKIVLQGRLKGKKIVLQYSHCIVEKEAWRVGFELQYTGVYCNRGSWVRLGVCIVIQKLYYDCGARARLDCIAIQWLAKPRYSRGWAVGARAGRAGRAGRRRGAGLGVRGALGWAWQAWSTASRARGRRGTRKAGCAAGTRDMQGACGRQAQARGRGVQRALASRRGRRAGNTGSVGRARLGRAGWPWAMH